MCCRGQNTGRGRSGFAQAGPRPGRGRSSREAVGSTRRCVRSTWSNNPRRPGVALHRHSRPRPQPARVRVSVHLRPGARGGVPVSATRWWLASATPERCEVALRLRPKTEFPSGGKRCVFTIRPRDPTRISPPGAAVGSRYAATRVSASEPRAVACNRPSSGPAPRPGREPGPILPCRSSPNNHADHWLNVGVFLPRSVQRYGRVLR